METKRRRKNNAQVAERSIAPDCKSGALVATGVRIPPCAHLFFGVGVKILPHAPLLPE